MRVCVTFIGFMFFIELKQIILKSFAFNFLSEFKWNLEAGYKKR